MTTTAIGLFKKIHFTCVHDTNKSSLLLQGRRQLYRIRFFPLQQNKTDYKGFDSSCTFYNNCRLLLGRLCLLLLLLLPSSAERGTKRLRSDAQPTRLFDDRLVYWQCRTVNLDDILQDRQTKWTMVAWEDHICLPFQGRSWRQRPSVCHG